MTLFNLLVKILLLSLIALNTNLGSAQNYPEKPVRIVTSDAGGGNDFAARIIGQQLSAVLGQPVIVDNRVGIIAVETVAKSPPDGYTVLLNGSVIWVTPLTQKNARWDATKDFSPITLAAITPNILVVHPSLPAKSVKELIALAKAKPGALNYASGTAGTTVHVSAELFKTMAQVDIVRITYKGNGPALNDLVAGHVQLMFATAGSVAPYLKAGRLRALAVTSARPSALLPGLPTIAAAGVAGYEASTMVAILAPAKTPDAIVSRLNQDITRVLKRTDVNEKFGNAGLEIVGSSPAQLAASIKSEIATLSKVLREAGIHPE